MFIITLLIIGTITCNNVITGVLTTNGNIQILFQFITRLTKSDHEVFCL